MMSAEVDVQGAERQVKTNQWIWQRTLRRRHRFEHFGVDTGHFDVCACNRLGGFSGGNDVAHKIAITKKALKRVPF